MAHYKKGTEEEWMEVGRTVKIAYEAIIDALSKANKVVPKTHKGMKCLNSAYKNLMNAKSELENKMFSDLDPATDKEEQKLLNVFYGPLQGPFQFSDSICIEDDEDEE